MSIDPQTMLSQNLDPRFFNRYAYTFNDPVNLTDPHGECPWCVALAVIYVADKVYGAYDAAQTAKGVANGTIDPVDAAVEQGAGQLGGLIAGPVGRQIGKRGARVGKTIKTDGSSKASDIAAKAEEVGFTPSQTKNGPLKFKDENGVDRVTIKSGSDRAPGSSGPHVELKDSNGQRVNPAGEPVTRKSPENHTPIIDDREP